MAQLSRREGLLGLGATLGLGLLPRPAWASVDPSRIHALLDSESGWTTRSDLSRDGVSVFSRAVPEQTVPAFKGLLQVASSPKSLWDAIYNIAGHMQVSDMLSESRVLYDNGTVLHYYQVSKVPSWMPVSDRYWFLKSSSTRDRNGTPGHNKRIWNPLDAATLYPEALADVQRRYPDAVTPRHNHGSWEVVPTGPKSCTLIYRIFSHPGGNISDSLASQMSSRTLPDNLLNFKKAAEAKG